MITQKPPLYRSIEKKEQHIKKRASTNKQRSRKYSSVDIFQI